MRDTESIETNKQTEAGMGWIEIAEWVAWGAIVLSVGILAIEAVCMVD